ncbi:MAG: hypothetical protein A2V74_10715 [Acidobacteria bacterium RBG_16_70_10]|nr:MAG: hypothetical protein A2V74_10715 [Acidobacteria bacterium RBG_16_70_10]
MGKRTSKVSIDVSNPHSRKRPATNSATSRPKGEPTGWGCAVSRFIHSRSNAGSRPASKRSSSARWVAPASGPKPKSEGASARAAATSTAASAREGATR